MAGILSRSGHGLTVCEHIGSGSASRNDQLACLRLTMRSSIVVIAAGERGAGSHLVHPVLTHPIVRYPVVAAQKQSNPNVRTVRRMREELRSPVNDGFRRSRTFKVVALDGGFVPDTVIPTV